MLTAAAHGDVSDRHATAEDGCVEEEYTYAPAPNGVRARARVCVCVCVSFAVAVDKPLSGTLA